ncbi:hypothetical protein AB0O91_04525 [Kitasatospora sp. NPDC089797]|uniref:hypothetical protein n=1 Tax=Kitasatospora sp. NPDC089797 TaxID=3155298 RepID=UPI0034187AE3
MTTPATTAPPPHRFWRAGVGHYRAAALLEQKEPGPADHLAGISAECALKAILIDFLGSQDNGNKAPMHPKTGNHGHVDKLWPQLAQLAQGRVGAALLPLIAHNPFAGWKVDHRYEDGSAIQAADLAVHIQMAQALCVLYDDARNGRI